MVNAKPVYRAGAFGGPVYMGSILRTEEPDRCHPRFIGKPGHRVYRVDGPLTATDRRPGNLSAGYQPAGHP
ncbi:hypothetical protein D3C87_1348290 [compost metagenome]